MKMSNKTLAQHRHEEDDSDEDEDEDEEGEFDVAEYERRGFSKSSAGGGGDSSHKLRRLDSLYDSSADEYDSEDEDEDEDEEREEDEMYSSSGRKRKRHSSNPFIDDQAIVATDDEDDDYERGEVDRDFIEPDENIPEEHEATRMQHRRMLPQEDEEVDVDEFERRIRQRYSSQSYLEEGIDEISDVEQQALLPSIKDPKLWMVKCAMGREREAAVCLMQKRIDRGHREMQIRSVISPHYLKNYIYVEADKSAHVIEACKGLRILNTTKVMLVPTKEMTDVLLVEGNPIDIAKDMWVRLRIGIYKGALAKVVNVSDVRQKVMVKLIPRVDLQAIADKLEGRKVSKKAYIPSPRLMKIDEARNLNIPVDYRTGRSTNIQFCVIDGKMFKDGFLYKTVSMRSIDYQNIQPTFSELEKFCETGHGVVGSMSTSPRNRKKSHFMKGDAVIVVKGDLKNLMGWVEKVEEDNVHIRPKVKGLCTTVAVNEKYVCKSFKPGDHVKVVFGAHKGVTGMVIKVNSNVLIILSDATKEDIRVFAEHAVDSSEVTTGVTKVGDYELHDLVMLDNTCFGVIIRLESQTLQILLGDPDRPDVARVKMREIKYKIQRRNTALDQSNNTVSVKDVVKILMGPCKGKQGPVEHIFRGTLFINDRHHMEHSGFICVRAQSCIVMGGSPAKVSLSSKFGSSTDAARVAPSPRRFPSGGPPFDSGGRQKSGQRGHDSFVGRTIKIHIGHYKGCRGRVVSVKGQSVRVELESQMKTVLVNRDEISAIPDVSTSLSEPPQHGLGSETPIHRAQTPTHSYATPTRNEGGTPRHSGTWTPLRDQAWNPEATTTPSGEKWEDGNPGSWGTIPPTQTTPLGRSNKAPSAGSDWGNWGDGDCGSRGTVPPAQPATPLARSNEAPSTGTGWGNWGDGNRGSPGTIPPAQQTTSLARSNEAPSAGSDWGNWGDGNRGSRGTVPPAQQATSLARSNEAPSTGTGWGSWGDGNRGSPGTIPPAQATPLARSNEAPSTGSSWGTWGDGNPGSRGTIPPAQQAPPLSRSNEAPGTGSGWGNWGNGNPGSRGTVPPAQQAPPLSRSNEAPSTSSGLGNWGDGSSPQCGQGTPRAHSNEAPALAQSTGSGWGGKNGSQGSLKW
ncbi:putative transcription elongation factor SPT5 homolog 1 isoform X3 [Papaver somniferum]|uniref:putative transcription elongation factor SPT5 homolog 1 isoform X3 n=1 Tax=Papaver somniferum TaxID=3469 RepID=UPI000E6F66EB|nr:putative transcription elongation factor SPT5 homolog 1 isoform X3 [Papaver somniferum]